uniref:Uncharacterized protein n=1 Tax=Candidatus Kentrum sp. DK TaxID=2126562 RepID=A0A450RXZ2_9GAMM|nr:MAG: hypothetical protein BECKDK2373C_GA0170839_100713 [Candidatus Kentron sp. DK]
MRGAYPRPSPLPLQLSAVGLFLVPKLPAWERNSRKLQLPNHARPSWKLGCEEKIPDMVIAGTARSYYATDELFDRFVEGFL